MRAAVMYGAGDVRVETVPDPVIEQPTDAIVRMVRSCICGSDLHPYHAMKPTSSGAQMGHEFLGVVEDLGAEVDGLSKGDLVVASFTYQDNTCEFCQEGLLTSCLHGGFYPGGCQAEAVRVPQAAGTLYRLPVAQDSALLPSLLTLADVYGTGFHAARTAGVRPGDTVTVIGDGAVGLLAVLAAHRLGAERIILMGRHAVRTDLGRDFGATDVVAERGEEGINAVRELTGGNGSRRVLECVGYLEAYNQALGVVRDGGSISRVGVPQYAEGPLGRTLFSRNVTLTGGVAPVRAYVEELLPDILDGTVEPGRVFDQTLTLDRAPEGYQAMDQRTALKVLLTP